MSYQYDLAGNRTRVTWPDAAPNALYAAYVHDLLNRVTAVEENGATSGPGLLASFAYDNLGRRTSLARGNGLSTSYSYDADQIAAKIRRAKTDAEPLPGDLDGLRGRPEADNLVGIYAALSGQTKAQVLAAYAGQGFGQSFKPALTEIVVQALAPVSAETRRWLAAPADIDAVLRDGAERARALAAPVMEQTRRIVGFWPGG